MPVYKNEKTKNWEQEFLLLKAKDLNISFEQFWNIYSEDMRPLLRKTTWESKEHIARTKLLPCFGEMPMNQIKPVDIIKWQKEIIQMRKEDGSEYSSIYFKTIQSQLSAIFNHAVRYYNLECNPVKKAMPMKGGKTPVFKYWPNILCEGEE